MPLLHQISFIRKFFASLPTATAFGNIYLMIIFVRHLIPIYSKMIVFLPIIPSELATFLINCSTSHNIVTRYKFSSLSTIISDATSFVVRFELNLNIRNPPFIQAFHRFLAFRKPLQVSIIINSVPIVCKPKFKHFATLRTSRFSSFLIRKICQTVPV